MFMKTFSLLIKYGHEILMCKFKGCGPGCPYILLRRMKITVDKSKRRDEASSNGAPIPPPTPCPGSYRGKSDPTVPPIAPPIYGGS